MKKVAFLFAAVVAVSFASCGNCTKNGACADSCTVDTEEVAVEEACCAEADSCCAGDTCTVDSCSAPCDE